MGRVSDSYNEAELCPRVMPYEWWFTLPSQTRRRIREETGYALGEGTIYPIGQVQDQLIVKGLGRLMGTYMRAMQACLDQEKVDLEAAMQESQVRSAMIDSGTQYMNRTLDETITTYENAAGRHDHPHFGFHEPRS